MKSMIKKGEDCLPGSLMSKWVNIYYFGVRGSGGEVGEDNEMNGGIYIAFKWPYRIVLKTVD